MKTCCTVVIGHVDHGKTALVRALTGIETDRLPEEKARGLSMTPGFAHRAYPGGTMDFIDAPGHEDFLQAMIIGAAGASAALLVVSATEGIRPQTVEHLTIAGLLGISRGVVAVTKSDLIETQAQTACLSAIRGALSNTSLAQADIVFCSAQTGAGIDDLHGAMQDMLSQAAAASAPLKAFLPIDRVFSMPGLGTIVTGTLLGQEISVEDTVTVQPEGRSVTVRGLQSRGAPRSRIQPGERMAANLRGVAVEDVSRGAVLCRGPETAPSTCIDVHLALLPTAQQPLKHMDEVRFLFGTSSAVAQVRLFGGGRIAEGDAGFAQLRFRKPVVGFAGQRAVLRHLSPAETIGGAICIDPQATPTRSGDKIRLGILQAAQARDIGDIAAGLCAAGGGLCALSDVARLARTAPDQTRRDLEDEYAQVETNVIASKPAIDACKREVMQRLAAYHAKHPLHLMAPRNVITPPATVPKLMRYIETLLSAEGQLRVSDRGLAAADHDPIQMLTDMQQHRLIALETAVRQADLNPLTAATLCKEQPDPELMALLLEKGRLLSLRNVALKQDLLFHPDTLASARMRLRHAFPPPQPFTTGEARAALATSRRTIVPLLEYFDHCGMTQRTEDTRVMATTNSISLTPPSC